MEIRGFTIKYSKIKAKNKKNEEAAFEDLLNDNLEFLALSEMKEKYNFEFPFTTYYGLLRWLDIVFEGQYLLRLSVNYIAINKDLEKLIPQLY